jgi:DNA-binding response OmpR family regulator
MGQSVSSFEVSTSLGRIRASRQRVEPSPIRRLLVIVDDKVQQQRLAIEADAAGFDTHFATSAVEALATQHDDWSPDAIVLDQLLPRSEQYATIRKLRSAFHVPLLVASDEIGASETPFDRAVVMLSRGSLISEARHVHGEDEEPPKEIIVGKLTLNTAHGKASADGRSIAISPEEAVALGVLMHRAGEFVTRQTLLAAMIRAHRDLDPRIIDVYIVRLMVKLEDSTSLRIVRSQQFDAYKLVDIG